MKIKSDNSDKKLKIKSRDTKKRSKLFSKRKEFDFLNDGITNYQLDMLRNNKSISLNTLEKICKIMNLRVEEVVEIK